MKGSNHHLCPKMCVHRGGDRCLKAMVCSIESRVSTFLFCWEAGYPHLNIFWQSRSWDGKLCTSVKKPVLPSKGSHQPFRHHHSISGMSSHQTIGIYSLFREGSTHVFPWEDRGRKTKNIFLCLKNESRLARACTIAKRRFKITIFVTLR